MSAPEFSRLVDVHRVPGAPLEVVANETERAALAKRFGLIAVNDLRATLAFTQDAKAISATGQLHARIVQSCAVSGEDLPVTIDEPLALRFVREREIEAEEVELAPEDLDEIPYTGETFDLGEEVSQSLGLAIDPYAEGPEAERVRREAGLSDEAASGPFAALAALKKG
jgi:uncharacterized metal-binding protein YceD (DUF177 family)